MRIKRYKLTEAASDAPMRLEFGQFAGRSDRRPPGIALLRQVPEASCDGMGRRKLAEPARAFAARGGLGLPGNH